ncbi:hypothetical protein MD484_g4917, partial [Candolleomyces efflorescens]
MGDCGQTGRTRQHHIFLQGGTFFGGAACGEGAFATCFASSALFVGLELPGRALRSATAASLPACPAARSSTLTETFFGAAEDTFVDLWVTFADGAPPLRFEITALSVAYDRDATRQLWAALAGAPVVDSRSLSPHALDTLMAIIRAPDRVTAERA